MISSECKMCISVFFRKSLIVSKIRPIFFGWFRVELHLNCNLDLAPNEVHYMEKKIWKWTNPLRNDTNKINYMEFWFHVEILNSNSVLELELKLQTGFRIKSNEIAMEASFHYGINTNGNSDFRFRIFPRNSENKSFNCEI